jgi:hypothetical protein
MVKRENVKELRKKILKGFLNRRYFEPLIKKIVDRFVLHNPSTIFFISYFIFIIQQS